MPVLIEACVDSVATAVAAVAAGAGRVELCGPGAGGTTPSRTDVAGCLTAVSVPVHVMIRPHDRGFVYDDNELATMVDSVAMARATGAHGVVFGALTRGHRLAESELAMLVAAARPMRTIIHRAFDRVPDATAALQTLLDIGVDGVLTSGLAPTALEGAEILGALREQAGGRLTIMAGGSVRGANVREIVRRSGVNEVHARGIESTIIAEIAEQLHH